MVHTLFSIQDDAIIFDAEPWFKLNGHGQSFDRQRVVDNPEEFIDFVLEKLPDTNTAKYFQLCTRPDESDFAKNLKEMSDRGYSPASFHLSYLYEHGEQGFEKNPELEITYLKIAAAQNHPHAKWILGTFYIGKGNIKTGNNLVISAAIDGFVPAIEMIANSDRSMRKVYDILAPLDRLYDY